ncbi:MAG TPA: CopD family protein [Gemmatimonadales bacterium]|nr:CopD family protein [Gemmatimonadales bacterium]
MSALETTARAVAYAGAFAAIGAAAARALAHQAWRDAAHHDARVALQRAVVRIGAAGAWMVPPALLVLLRVQAAQLVDDGERLGRAHVELALASDWGTTWKWQLAAALLAVVAWLPGRARPLAGWRLTPLAGLALAATFALAGHPRVLPIGPMPGVLLGAVHLYAAALWIGGLAAVLGTAWRGPAEGRELRASLLVRRYSAIATVVAPLTLLTGAAIAWQTVGPLRTITATPYGQALLWKLGLVLVAALFGAYHRQVSVPRLGSPAGELPFRRTAAAELVAALLVLAATAALVALPAPGLD